jgi:hypothetical protein
MLGLKTDQEVLAELVRMKLPAVAALMDGHGVLWTLLVSRWFVCLFIDTLPVEVSTWSAPGAVWVTMEVTWDFCVSPDCASDLGLFVQRRFQNHLPGGPDLNQTPPGTDTRS